MPLGIEVVEAPVVAAGVLIAALGAWLLRRNAQDPVGRAFALLLLATGGAYATWRASGALGDAYERASVYLLIAVPLLALHFVSRYRARSAGRAPARWVPGALAVAFVALAIPVTLDHTLYVDPDGIFDFGPLWPLRIVPGVVFVGLGTLLAQDYLRESLWSRRQGVYFLALALALAGTREVVFDGAFGLVDLLQGQLTPARDGFVTVSLAIAAYVTALVLFVSMLASAARNARPGDRARGLVFTAALASAAWLPVAFQPYAPQDDAFARFVWPQELALGVTLLVFAALGAYAALRHRALDLDARMRLGVKGGTLGAVFLAVSFVASEGAAMLVGQRYGALVGLGSAAVLLAGLQPLQRAAERVAQGALPEAKALSAMDRAERLALYREQVQLSWADGAMTKSEKLRLEKLRERLAISLEESATIDREAATA